MEGHEAHSDGVPRIDNPYRHGSVEAVDWDTGWDRSEAEENYDMTLGASAVPTTPPYRGYVATYELVDGKFLIVLKGTADVVTATADTATAVQRAFEAMVDDYLATRQEIGS